MQLWLAVVVVAGLVVCSASGKSAMDNYHGLDLSNYDEKEVAALKAEVMQVIDLQKLKEVYHKYAHKYSAKSKYGDKEPEDRIWGVIIGVIIGTAIVA